MPAPIVYLKVFAAIYHLKLLESKPPSLWARRVLIEFVSRARDKSSVPRPPARRLSAATLDQPSARAYGAPPTKNETRIEVGVVVEAPADGRPFTASSTPIERANDSSELGDTYDQYPHRL